MTRSAAVEKPYRACVLVLAGVDPSGGAGVYADLQAIGAVGAHALPVVTVLTVQDQNRVHSMQALAPQQILAQAEALLAALPISAVKLGVIGSRVNAEAIAALLQRLRLAQPTLPVVLDPVLASGAGDTLSADDPLDVIAPLLAQATLVTPNLPEARALCGGVDAPAAQAALLFDRGAQHVLIKGGHGDAEMVENHLFSADGATATWRWPRLPGEFHGSGCTLAAAIAGLLAQGMSMRDASEQGQHYCQAALAAAYMIGPGQAIPDRFLGWHASSG